jgi:capsular exopolysaccharide synthesis family protein
MASYFEDAKRVDLRDYGRILLRRVWLVIVPAVVALIVAFVASLPRFMPPVYESQARLVLEMPPSLSQDMRELITQPRASDQIDRIRNMITSTEFLRGMIRQMDDLRNDQGARRWAHSQKDRHPSATEEELVELYLMKYLRQTIDLGIDRRQPGVFRVKVADYSPHRALRLCQRITDAVVEESIHMVDEYRAKTRNFASERLASEREKLEVEEERLRQLEAGALRSQSSSRLISEASIPQVEGLKYRIQGDLESLRNNLATKKARVQEFGEAPSRWLGITANVKVEVQQYVDIMRSIGKAEIRDLNIQGADTAGSLQIQSAQTRNELQSRLRDLVATQGSSLSAATQSAIASMIISDLDLQATEARYRTVGAEIDAYRGRSATAPGRQIEIDRARTTVDNRRATVQMFENAIINTEIQASVQEHQLGGSIDVLEPATLPLEPISPNRPIILGLAVVGGVLLGLMLAFVVDHHDLTIRDVTELPVEMRDQVIGSMPLIRDRITKEREFRKTGMKGEPISLFDYYRDEAASSFEFRRLVLELTREGGLPHSIMSTSSERNEGKTTTSCLLALTIARHRKLKTVLVDLDFRKPSVHKEMGIAKGQPGSAEALNARSLDPDVIQATPESNLFVLPAGSFRQISAETVTPESIKWLIAELRKTFDVVIFDTPPNLAVPDPLVIGQAVDAVLFVVKAGSTSQAVLKRGFELQIRANDNEAGVVLNNVRDVMPYYYNYEYYGYSAEEEATDNPKAAVGDAT